MTFFSQEIKIEKEKFAPKSAVLIPKSQGNKVCGSGEGEV